MKYLMWLLKAAIFFTLFAFALNNQQVVAVNFFFGTVWKAPLIMVVLSVFTAGLALGVLLMIPRWWNKKALRRSGQAAGKDRANLPVLSSAPVTSAPPAVAPTGTHPVAHGL